MLIVEDSPQYVRPLGEAVRKEENRKAPNEAKPDLGRRGWVHLLKLGSAAPALVFALEQFGVVLGLGAAEFVRASWVGIGAGPAQARRLQGVYIFNKVFFAQDIGADKGGERGVGVGILARDTIVHTFIAFFFASG